jgi:hypothetical protein
MHNFSTRIATPTKMPRATPTVSGTQRARGLRGHSPLLFRLFNRGESRSGLEAVAEKKRAACSGKSCADNRRRTGEISGGITGEDQAAIVAGSRAIAGTLRAARVRYFLRAKMGFGRTRETLARLGIELTGRWRQSLFGQGPCFRQASDFAAFAPLEHAMRRIRYRGSNLEV